MQFFFFFCQSVAICRYDIAIDVPYAREDIRLIKDRRKKSLEMNSERDKTEYLGVRDTAGRVKVYNKALESELDDSTLTRVEVTFGSVTEFETEYCRYMPMVRLNASQRSFMLSDGVLSNTQEVLATAIRDSEEPETYMRMLKDKRLKKKIEPYVYADSVQLEFDKKSCEYIIACLKEYVKEK